VIKISAAELQRDIDRYQDLALTQAVAVTRNGREQTVLISIDEYHPTQAPRTAGPGFGRLYRRGSRRFEKN
jgi:PHD/YefM family antitoxin component YafN of YafNO toxin-antitoxin module